MLLYLAALSLALLGLFRRPPLAYLTAFFQVRHLLFPLALPLAAVGIWRGEFALTLLSGVALGAGWVRCGAMRAPARSQHCALAAERQPDLRVATLNAGDHRSDPAQICSWAAECGADVICLQEFHAGHVALLEQELGTLYPHQVLFGDGMAGIGVLSRKPILAHDLVRMRSRLPFLKLDLDVDGTPLRLIAVHPFASLAILGKASSAHQDMLDLAREAGQSEVPCLLVGDMNTTDQSSTYDALAEAGLTDAWTESGVGWAPTFPVAGRYMHLPVPPVVRIDFVWYSDRFEVCSYETGPDASSDHLPVLVSLAWRGRGTSPGEQDQAQDLITQLVPLAPAEL
ncbi:MAG: endonuclease/exonuclease/phosphatase (EEP) superfamily protein YafD [Planctomycetota bacterium]|jgi:endonuclease/exonuclease/phosphatase (EEP) superfamily protein YafD